MTNSSICAEMIGKYSRSWTVHLSPQHLQEKENPLYREIIERIEIKKFICKECGRDFSTKTFLEHPMVGTHNSHANIKSCNHCEKFFKSLETLGKHKKLLHENSFKKYPCVAKHYRTRQIWSITSSDIIPTRSFLVKRVAKPSQLTKIFWNTSGGITPGGKRVSNVDSVNSSSMTSMDWETTWLVSTIRYCEVCQLCDH